MVSLTVVLGPRNKSASSMLLLPIANHTPLLRTRVPALSLAVIEKDAETPAVATERLSPEQTVSNPGGPGFTVRV
eukprot:823212-Rhodomonas_salina.2